MKKIQTALISVYDKTGLIDFAKALSMQGVQIVSSGGTSKALKEAGVACREVSEITHFPEMLDGRVKTLHPNVHGGLLARRDVPEHMQTIQKHGIAPIDMVVINLYPFAEAVRSGKSREDVIEMIDIGGPAMLRSAAKNHASVASVCDAADYPVILAELERNGGSLSEETLAYLAGKTFARTSAYDANVTAYLVNGSKTGAAASALPQSLDLKYEKTGDLRYGENPHQAAAFYREAGSDAWGLASAQILGGKELSFNNYLDLENARFCAAFFEDPAAVVMKHTNPCGAAVGRDATDAYKKAYDGDPLSAFGGIIGVNRAVDGACAKAISESGFMECVIAPDYTAEALEILRAKKNFRIVKARFDFAEKPKWDFKRVAGGLLVQEPDAKDVTQADLKTVTKKSPGKEEIADILFAFRMTRFVKSNAIVVVKDKKCVGIGMGLTSRVDSAMLAFRKAGDKARGAVLASDGFFPKPDSIDEAAKAGIRTIVQPGGSIQDAAVIEACDRLGIAMVTTGVRHFTH